MFRYNGLRIIMKEVSSFEYFATKSGSTLLIYVNKDLSNDEKSKVLHKSIRNMT
ncbi:hypothetical protein SDC9_212591 [bioreactor metagenome]|uniref:Uncharacterized protein n=1 Tax=bioreactor metagenome TaxID=1076179 RepID=A0A645JZK8_9ZZZZ